MADSENETTRRGREPGETLAQLATEMVLLQKQYWGRGPESAKAYAMDDLLFIVMRGGATTAERTMLESGRQDSVRATRQEFENDMAERLTGMVEDVTGRKVLNYQSQILFDPDLVVELFVFDKNATAPARATAEGQLDDDPVGEVHGEDVKVDGGDTDKPSKHR